MWTVTLLLRDSYGRDIHKRVQVDVSTLADAVDAISGVGGYLTALAAVTDLAFIEANYVFAQDTTGAFAGTGSSNADVGATFKVALAEGGNASHKIPGFPASLVNADGGITVSGSEVAAYFAHFLTGDLRLSDGEAISAVVKGKLDK
jgi:hypothetical protein